MPASGNLQGFVQILGKTDIELQGGSPAAVAAVKQKLAGIKTLADAEAYANDVTARAKQAAGPVPPPPRPIAASA
jgi:phospholipase C